MLISHTTYLASDDCNHSFHIDVGPDSGSEGFSLGEREMLAAQLLKPLSVFGDSPVCLVGRLGPPPATETKSLNRRNAPPPAARVVST